MDVLVRLRGFPEGRLRRYEGERFLDRVDYVPPFVPGNIEEVCAQAPLLELGKKVTVRRGFAPFPPDWVGDCAAKPIATGSAAARVVIPKAGSYTFGVVAVSPDLPEHFSGLIHSLLALRTACDAPDTALACSNGLNAEGKREKPEIRADNLEAGTYFLVTAGWFRPQGADFTLAAARTSDWTATKASAVADIAPEPRELFVDGDPYTTPLEEPQPESTVDRLVAVRLQRGRVRQVSVVLHGACSGTMADLADGIASGRTCVDQEGVLEPISIESGDPPTSLQPSKKSFGAGEPCPPQSSSPETVCVPGGATLLGLLEGAGLGDKATTPERLAVLERFWIDRHEVTVARYRAALAQGFVPDPALGEPKPTGSDALTCTWSPEKGSREDHPLNCIRWFGARAFCQFLGGDLPTEAQWDYVTQSAGRDADTVFAWGNDPPCCGTTVPKPCHLAALQFGTCVQHAIETVPVHDFAGTQGDVSAGLGIVGLAGNVREWGRDAFEVFGHPCWRGSRIRERTCQEPQAPSRPALGGDFGFGTANAALRRRFSASFYNDATGFRCVYPAAPGSSR